MKLADILLLEKPSINLVVLQASDAKGRPWYRVDPNPDHTAENYKGAWTQNISEAKVFKEKAARRFLRTREQQSRERMVQHKNLKMIPVELDQTGRPMIPKPEKPRLIDRMRRRA